MTIRRAIESDVPSIIRLLKQSLGESLMPKSESFWKWKHELNPFGQSPTLLSFEGKELVGVRAFMRWQWQQGSKIFRAVRAVDTATHPQYQGKGIFKNLTLQLVDQCKYEDVDFIFNTPNKNSLPGYLKMGWQRAGRLKICIQPNFKLSGRIDDFETAYSWHSQKSKLERFNNQLSEHRLRTHYSNKFLQWRYGNNPNVNYYTFYDDSADCSYQVIFRLKPFRGQVEFRICDVFLINNLMEGKMVKHLRKVVKESGAFLVTGCDLNLEKYFWAPSLKLGPIITIRPLSMIENHLSFPNWQPSIGDLEVF
jgi:N-acetylglutamate synthase-like GNAT family acetyltransferase